MTEDSLVTAEGERIPATFKLWAAGIKSPEFLKDIKWLETNWRNQVVTFRDLRSVSDSRVYAIGDCAACPLDEERNRWAPPSAQNALQ